MHAQPTLILTETDLQPYLDQFQEVSGTSQPFEIEALTSRLGPEGWRLDMCLRPKQKTLDEVKQELIDGALKEVNHAQAQAKA